MEGQGILHSETVQEAVMYGTKRPPSPMPEGEDGERKRRRPTEGASDKCFNCGEFGHLARDCPQPTTLSGKLCYLCNRRGHMAKFCPERVKQLERDLALERSSYYYGGYPAPFESFPPPAPLPVERERKACYICGSDTHLARSCPTPRFPQAAGAPPEAAQQPPTDAPASGEYSDPTAYAGAPTTYPAAAYGAQATDYTYPAGTEAAPEAAPAATEQAAYPGYTAPTATPAAAAPAYPGYDGYVPPPFPGESGPKCYNCGGFGHFAKECTQPTSMGKCYNCGLGGKDCPTAGQKLCFICRKPGHMSAQCPEKSLRTCYNCGETTHISTECPRPSTLVCHICKQTGHKALRCPYAPSMGYPVAPGGYPPAYPPAAPAGAPAEYSAADYGSEYGYGSYTAPTYSGSGGYGSGAQGYGAGAYAAPAGGYAAPPPAPYGAAGGYEAYPYRREEAAPPPSGEYRGYGGGRGAYRY